MAYHPDTGALYVPLNLQCETAAFGPVEQRPGGGGTGGVRGRLNHFHPDAPGQLGEFQALDIRTGETLWKHRLRVPYNTAALTTGGVWSSSATGSGMSSPTTRPPASSSGRAG